MYTCSFTSVLRPGQTMRSSSGDISSPRTLVTTFSTSVGCFCMHTTCRRWFLSYASRWKKKDVRIWRGERENTVSCCNNFVSVACNVPPPIVSLFNYFSYASSRKPDCRLLYIVHIKRPKTLIAESGGNSRFPRMRSISDLAATAVRVNLNYLCTDQSAEGWLQTSLTNWLQRSRQCFDLIKSPMPLGRKWLRHMLSQNTCKNRTNFNWFPEGRSERGRPRTKNR